VEELEELETRILRKVYTWLVIIGIGGGTVAGTGVLRTGKFTDSDAALMELTIRSDMPPLKTRQRILHIEDFLHEKYQDFKSIHRGEW